MIKEITINEEKQNICRLVLSDLPEWFGIEESTEVYIKEVANYPFIGLYVDGEVAGFYSLREENKETLDMYVLGLRKKYHGKGYGKLLQDYVKNYARNRGYKRLIVLTLSSKHSDTFYAKTRDFYHKQGFVDVYESDKIWDEHNPTLIMLNTL